MSFDIGLEQVSRAESGPSGLPPLDAILPSRAQLPDEVARVMPDSQLRRLLDGFLSPATVPPELLLPGRFATTFDGLRSRLDRDRRRQPALAEAADLLEEERISRDLLDYYRAVLLSA